MRFGFCLGLGFLQDDSAERKLFDAVAEVGYDYVELPLSQVAELTKDEISKLETLLKTIPCRACNLFFPIEVAIVGADMDIPGIKAYLEKTLPIAASLGIETLVFGNGGARKIPDGATYEETFAQLRAVVEIMDEYASKTGISIVVEPLNTTETNILISYDEAVRLAQGLTYVTAMVDSYHAAMEKQGFDDVSENPKMLMHLHTAYPIGRYIPELSDDMRLYAEFADMAKHAGYNGKLSVEGRMRNKRSAKEEVGEALQVLKSLYK